jgi:hypothetical protein
MGLGFFRGECAAHRVVSHEGILPGFNGALLVAPDDGLGIVAFTNGSAGAFAWLPVELDGLLRGLLGIPDQEQRGLPQQPWTWTGLCGRYVFQPRISDLRIRLTLGRGVEVAVVGGRLVVRLLTPLPMPRRGLPLLPAGERDPDVFRLDLSAMGMPAVRVVFARGRAGRATAVHTDLGGQPWSLVRCDGPASRRARLGPVLGVATVAAAVGVASRRARSRAGAGRRGQGRGRSSRSSTSQP